MTAEEIAEAVIVNMELRADLLAQRLAASDPDVRAQLQEQIKATYTRADELASLQDLTAAVAKLRNPPTRPPADPDLVSNLQERATLLEQSAAAADQAARDAVQLKIQLNSAKADDIAKLRAIQGKLAHPDDIAAAADAAVVEP